MILFVCSVFIPGYSYCGDTVSVMFLGDTYFGESYQSDPKYNHGTNVLTAKGYDYLFANVGDMLRSADFVISNFEASLADIKMIPAESPFEFIHYSNPDSTLYYLSKYHIGACNLANNHSLDLGYAGLNFTTNAFKTLNIIPFGAGENGRKASEPLHKTFKINGKDIQLFVIGCYWPRPAYEELAHFYADENSYGVNKLNPDRIASQVNEIRSNYPEAFIVVYPHWGSNYKLKNSYQDSAAHSLIDAGVDLIIGQGAHTVQEIESYKGKLILYNIGNFIFAAPGRFESTSALPYGFMAELKFTLESVALNITPVYTNNPATGYQVGGLMKDEFGECLSQTIKNDSLRTNIKFPSSNTFSISLR